MVDLRAIHLKIISTLAKHTTNLLSKACTYVESPESFDYAKLLSGRLSCKITLRSLPAQDKANGAKVILRSELSWKANVAWCSSHLVLYSIKIIPSLNCTLQVVSANTYLTG